MIRSFKAVSIYIFKSSVPLRLTEQPEKPIRQFNRSPVPIVFTGEREADRQTPALADYSERDRRPPVAVDESPEVGAREGRAVDGLDHVAGALLLRPHVLDFAAQGHETRARRALLGLCGRERGVLRALQLDCELERRYRGRAPHREVERGADAGLLEREREVFDAPHIARADARDNVACAQARERGGSPRRDRGQEHSLPPLYVRERRLRLPAEADPRFERGLKGLEAAEAEPRLRRARAELEHALARRPHRLDGHDLRLARTALRDYADDLARLVRRDRARPLRRDVGARDDAEQSARRPSFDFRQRPFLLVNDQGDEAPAGLGRGSPGGGR